MGDKTVLRMSILNPTGNITAIVESPVDISRQPAAAAAIMRRFPTVEQVGFLKRVIDDETVQGELRMAGGEFCGNASMSAAALLLLQGGQGSGEAEMRLRVSGASNPVSVRLRPEGNNACLAEIGMPPAREITQTGFTFGALSGELPLARLEGISHLVIEPASPFFALLQDCPAAERAVREFCEALHADGLGLLFLEGEGTERRMTPLVYIPGSGTCFWENSCASGSAAAGMVLAAKTGAVTALALREPGGTLRVSCDPAGITLLRGRVRLTDRLEIPTAEL